MLSMGAKACPNCGYVLGEASQPLGQSSQAAPATDNYGALYYATNRARQHQRRQNRWRVAAIAGIVLMLVAIAVAVPSVLLKSPPAGDAAVPDISATDAAVASAGSQAGGVKANTPPAMEYPANGYIFYGWAEENACPLTIETQGDQAYFIKLESLAGEDVFAFFVQPGQTVDTMAPLGSYVMKYASGVSWYGADDLFGADTAYTRADGIFDFTYSDGSYNGWTITLYTVADGNLTTDSISAGDF